jgi:hypothetical protein
MAPKKCGDGSVKVEGVSSGLQVSVGNDQKIIVLQLSNTEVVGPLTTM